MASNFLDQIAIDTPLTSGATDASTGEMATLGVAPNSYRDVAWDSSEQVASSATGVPVEVLRAIRLHGERSNGDQVSPVGARGVYQFMPKTRDLFLKKYGVDAYSSDPDEQATAAAYHLKESFDRTGDWVKAMAGYNGGISAEQGRNPTRENADYVRRTSAALGQVGADDVRGSPAATGQAWDRGANLVRMRAPAGGATTGDFLKEAGASLLNAVGSMGQFVGEGAAYAANAITGTEDYEGKNLLGGVAEGIRNSMTEGGKVAREASNVEGDVVDMLFGDWDKISLPETAEGWGMLMANGFGSVGASLIPYLGSATKARNLAKAAQAAQKAGDAAKATQLMARADAAARAANRIGAVSGAAMTGGGAAEESRQNVAKAISGMSHDELMADVPIYKEAFARYGDEGQARDAVVNSAARLSAVISAPFGAAGGYMGGKLLTDTVLEKGVLPHIGGKGLSGMAARTAVAGPVAGFGEGFQEVSEKVGSNIGENLALGRPALDDATRNTAGDFLGGFVTGGPVGSLAGVTTKPYAKPDPLTAVRDQADQPNSPLSRAATQAVDSGAAAAAQPQQPQVDPITARVQEVENQVRGSGLLNQLRDMNIEGMGADDFLQALATARNTKLDAQTPLLREQALEKVEQAMRVLQAPSAPAMAQQWRSMGITPAEGSLAQQRADEAAAQQRIQGVGQQWQNLSQTPQGLQDLAANSPAAQVGQAWQALQPSADRAGETSPLESTGSVESPRSNLGDGQAPAQAQPADAESIGQTWRAMRPGVTPTGPVSYRVPMSGPAGETSSLADAPKNYTLVPAPAVTIPKNGPGTAQVRKRKAEIGALVAQGFDTITQDATGAQVLANQKTGEAHPLTFGFDRKLAKDAIQGLVRAAADQSPNSPNNGLPQSTPAQNKAGNYLKPPVSLNGFSIRVENPKGSRRSGTDPDGKAWSVTMGSDYGYISGTRAADGDGVDVYVGDNPEAAGIFVIDQVNPDGTFDEPKVVMGVRDEAQARATYLSNYEPGWTGLGAITPMSRDQFDGWLKSGGPMGPTSQRLRQTYDAGSNTGANNEVNRGAGPGLGELAERAGGQAAQAAGGEPAAAGRMAAVDGSVPAGRAAEDGRLQAARAAIGRLVESERARGTPVEISEPAPDDRRLKAFEPLAAAFERVFGRRPIAVVATGDAAFDGVMHEGDYFVNLDAAQMPIAETIAHEFGHTQEDRPQVKALEDAMYALVPEGVRKRYYAYLLRTNQDLPRAMGADGKQSLDASYAARGAAGEALLRSELIRDFMGNRFNDKAWLQRLAREKPKEFGDFIREWIALLDNLIQEFKGAMRRAEEKDVDALMREHLAQLEGMKAIAIEVAAEWAKANPDLANRAGMDANGVPRYAKRAGPQENRPTKQFLVPQIDGAFDGDTGNLATMPSITVVRDGRQLSFDSMPVRVRVGQHDENNVGQSQFGATHRLANARSNPVDRALKTPDIGRSGQAQTERTVRDIALTVLTAAEAYPDKKFDSAVAVRSPETGETALLMKEFDRDGKPFWSVKTLIPKRQGNLREMYGSPVPIKGITLDGTGGSSPDAVVQDALMKLRAPESFLGDGDSYTVSAAGQIVNPDSAEARAKAQKAAPQDRPERGRVVKGEDGKLRMAKRGDERGGGAPDWDLRRSSRSQDNRFYENLRSRVAQRESDGRRGSLYSELDLVAGLSAGLEREGAVVYRTAGRNSDANDAIVWNGQPGFIGEYVSAGVRVKAADGSPGFMTLFVPSHYLPENPLPRDIAKAYQDGLFVVAHEVVLRDGVGVVASRGVRPGSRPHSEYADRIRSTGRAAPDGTEYLQLDIGHAASKAWLTESARRLAIHLGGGLPDLRFVRDTGANPGDEVRLLPAARAESRFSLRDSAGGNQPARTSTPAESGAPATRKVGNRLVRRMSPGDFTPVFEAKQLLADMAPSFRVERGEASADEGDVAAVNAILQERGSQFRLDARDLLPSDQSARLINNLKSTGYERLNAPVLVTADGGAATEVNAQVVLQEMDKREEALEHVRTCLI